MNVRRFLADYPDAGTPTDVPGVRQLAVSGYRVVYAVEADAGDVLVIAVLAPGQP